MKGLVPMSEILKAKAMRIKARELAHRVRCKRLQKTSSARRNREALGMRVIRLIEDVSGTFIERIPTFRIFVAKLICLTSWLTRSDVTRWGAIRVVCCQPGLSAWHVFSSLSPSVFFARTNRPRELRVSPCI